MRPQQSSYSIVVTEKQFYNCCYWFSSTSMIFLTSNSRKKVSGVLFVHIHFMAIYGHNKLGISVIENFFAKMYFLAFLKYWKFVAIVMAISGYYCMQDFCTCIIILYSFLFFDYGGPIVNHTLPAWKRIAFVSYRSAFPNGLTIKSIIDYMKILSCITLVLLEIFPFIWQILQEVKKIIDIANSTCIFALRHVFV